MPESDPRESTLFADTDLNCLDRRQLLIAGTGAAATVLLGQLFPGRVLGQDEDRVVSFSSYPRKRIGYLSKLVQDQPAEFLYPDGGPHSISLLVKLGRPAGGGIGTQQDVVAFNALCPHQGGLLREAYNGQFKVAGSCPLHLTTFDLTRHGMVVAGHATQGLPQVVLELEGDEIFAIGVVGLIYGYPASDAFVERSRDDV